MYPRVFDALGFVMQTREEVDAAAGGSKGGGKKRLETQVMVIQEP